MKLTMKKTLLALLIASASANNFAANVPAGTQLAEKQELIMNNSSNPATFDPQKMEGDVESNIAHQIYETLVISNEKGDLLPGAAERWEHSPDFKTWTFYLRPNAKWSNGDPVTAEDFVFAWQRLADPKTAAAYASYLNYLKLANAQAIIEGKQPLSNLGVQAKDAHTLVLNLTESVPYADRLVEHYVLAPVNKKVVEKFGDKWTNVENIVGNGAFKVLSSTVNEKIELVRNEYYWDNTNTVLNKVTLLPIESSSTDVARYRAGDEDITGKALPIEMFAKLKKELGNELVIAPALCTYIYEINTQKAPFNDVRVRKALALSVDRNIITDKIMRQGQIPAFEFTPPYIMGGEKITKPDWANWDQAKRNAEAVKLLQEAGFNKANPLNISLLYNTSEDHKKLAIAASSMWKKNLNGIVNVKLENQEWKTYLDTRHQGNFDVARAGWCADYNEASTFLNSYLSNSSNNTAFYKSKAFDDMMLSSYAAQTDDERADVYAKAEAQLATDLPFVPIYHYVQPHLVKPYVKGFAAAHPSQNYYFKDIYIVKH